MRFKDLGRALEFRLNKDYAVECRYKYVKKENYYSLTMWLVNKKYNISCPVDKVWIDTQPLRNSSKDTIWNDISKIVEYANSNGFFDPYIESFDYTIQCCLAIETEQNMEVVNDAE